jgi:ribosomal protein L11 methyltransferase
VWIRVPLERAEEARAEWLERFPGGFEELERDGELELAAYTDAAEPGLHAVDVEPGWEDRWREFHRPVRAGPFWIGPPWEAPPPDAIAVVIDPGRAFGTGAHPTTRLCVELVAEVAAAQLLDIGCGSGVISIAAALRGFPHVIAVDVDPAAIDASERNAAANGVVLDVRLLDAVTQPLPAADVVVANVSLEVVNALLSRVDAATVVCSGYLERDEPSLVRYRRLERRVLDGWAADLLERAE